MADLPQEEQSTNVRRGLARLRQRWEQHGPASPLCLAEEIEPGVTVAEFCVRFLLAQRTRRNGK
jgi:hypothetical protein